eukprot:c19634_g1_i1 orf=2-406(-)
MVGMFSRFSATKAVGLFSHSSLEGKEEVGIAREEARFPVEHGVQPLEEFMPIEHPMEPLENDCPVRCPQPEPCIIHDGRIWKERLHRSMQRRRELPFVQENEPQGLPHRRPVFHTPHVSLPQEHQESSQSVLPHN